MRRLETDIETKAVGQLQSWAISKDIDIRIVKLYALGNRGWPDRLLVWSGPGVMFVEFKRPGERVRKMQLFIHDILRRMGFEVQVHDNTNEAVESIKAYIQTTLGTDEGDETNR